MYLMRTGSYSPTPLMVTVQPLLINWEIHPSTSAWTKILLVSWIVSTETDPKAGGAYPPGTSHWSCTNWIRLRLNQSRRPPWSIWPSRRYSSWPLGRANAEVRFMLGKTKILDTNPIGQRCPRIHYPAFYPRISWSRGSRQCGPSGYNSPGPLLWIDLSCLTGPFFRLEHCATIWTGPQTSSRIRRWLFCLL